MLAGIKFCRQGGRTERARPSIGALEHCCLPKLRQKAWAIVTSIARGHVLPTWNLTNGCCTTLSFHAAFSPVTTGLAMGYPCRMSPVLRIGSKTLVSFVGPTAATLCLRVCDKRTWVRKETWSQAFGTEGECSWKE